MTEPEDVRCERCHRPLKDTDSRTRGYGPVCADIVLGVDTHRTPVPRAEHPADPNQIPLPLEAHVTTRIYKIVMTPEDTDDRVAYLIDKTGEPPVTEDDAADAFDVILCDNDGYELASFEEVAESDIPADARPYQVG